MNEQKTRMASLAAFSLLALMLVVGFTVPATVQAQLAADDNGIELPQPDGYTIAIDDEWYDADTQSGPPTDNNNPPTAQGQAIRNFKGHHTPSAVLAGYINMGEYCDTQTNTVVAVSLNGGPHNSQNAQYTDSMELEIRQADLDPGRLRTLPQFGGGYNTITGGVGGAIASPNFGSISSLCAGIGGEDGDGYFGYAAYKLNVDEDESGTPDHVAILAYIDIDGIEWRFDEEVSGFVPEPGNNWVKVFDGYYAPSDLTGLDSVFDAEIYPVSPSNQYQTFRTTGQVVGTFVGEDQYDDMFLTLKNVTSVEVDE